MKILFLSRSTLFTVPGGDTVQMEATAKYLRKLGVEVDIHTGSAVVEYHQYDLLHFFNIIRPADILFHTKRTNKPFVISPVYVDYSEYERIASRGLKKWLTKVLSGDQLEYIKAIARWFVNGEKIRSGYYLWNGHRRAIRKLLTQTKILLPNSHHEYQRLMHDYKSTDISYQVVPNGIDPEVFTKTQIETTFREGVLCVARIEGRKNQLNLIKAMNGTHIPLTLIGKPAPNHIAYYEACKNAADDTVTFIDYINQQELLEHYEGAKVHVLPSWFETTGLSSLEAAVMGCTIVVTEKGDTREYFGKDAWYCDPENIDSIRTTILEAYHTHKNNLLKERILHTCTWEHAAAQTLDAYKKVLSKL